MRIAFIPLALILGLTSYRSYKIQQQKAQQLLVCYQINNHTLVAAIKGQEAFLLGDSSILQINPSLDFATKNHFMALGIRKVAQCH